MTILTIMGSDDYDNDYSFEIAGSCLAILGKTHYHIEKLNDLFECEGITCVPSIRHEDILNFRDTDTVFLKEFLPKYLNLFPFSRTILSYPDEIAECGKAMFEVESYTLNEVMYAMFHLRALTLSNSPLFDVHPVEVFRMCDESGIPFWKAYLLAFAPWREDLSKWSLDDGNTYNYLLTSRDAMFDFLSGKCMDIQYEGRDFYTQTVEDIPYTKNMEEFLCTKDRKRMSVFYKRFHMFYGKLDGEVVDIFGNIHETSRADLNKASVALDKTMNYFNIDTKELIC